MNVLLGAMSISAGVALLCPLPTLQSSSPLILLLLLLLHLFTAATTHHLHPHHLLHHLADHNADFGNGWYNDHHFHYGYFIYAAAAVGVGNASFLKRWDVAVRHMVRHIAHPIYPDPTP